MASPNGKRKATASDSEPDVKKAKMSPPAPPSILIALSALRWDGKPTPHLIYDHGPINIGKYVNAGKVLLEEIGWSNEFMAHVYKPKGPSHFEYKRQAYF